MISAYLPQRAVALTSVFASLLGVPVLAQQSSGQSQTAGSMVESLRLSGGSSTNLRDSLAVEGYLDTAYFAQHPRGCTESQYPNLRTRRLNLPLPTDSLGWMELEVTERRLASGGTDLPVISVRRGAGEGPQLEGALMLGAFLRIERLESSNDRSLSIEMFPLDDPLTIQLREIAVRVLALPCSPL